MSAPALKLRIGEDAYKCPFSAEAAKPRLCLNHGGTTYYTPLADNTVKPRLAVNVNGSPKYAALRHDSLVVWLPFNNTVTEDLCGNTWTVTGSPTIKDDANAISGKSASFDGASRLLLNNITLGGQDFTVDFWMNLSTSTASGSLIFFIDTTSKNYDMVMLNRSGTSYTTYFRSNTKADCSVSLPSTTAQTSTRTSVGIRSHVVLVYRYAEKEMTLYINGVPAAQRNDCPQYTRQSFRISIFGGSSTTTRCTGTIEHFRVYDGYAARTEDFVAPNPDDFYKGCAVNLPFTNSPTEDKQGNTWKTVGNPVIQDDAAAISGKSLKLDGSSGLLLDEIELGGQDFTIDGWLNMSSSTPARGRILRLINTETGYGILTFSRDRDNTNKIEMWASGCSDFAQDWGNVSTTSATWANQRIHFAIVYSYSAGTVTLYINGTQATQATGRPKYNRSTFRLSAGYNGESGQFLTGTIEHFRIHDGQALWTAAFTPPTADDYDESIVVHMPFDTSTTEDKCGNEWVVYDDTSPTISGKAFTNGSITMSDSVTLGGQDFTIDYISTGVPSVWTWLDGEDFAYGAGRLIYLQKTGTNSINVYVGTTPYTANCKALSYTMPTGKTHIAFVYQHSASRMKVYVNGKLVTSASVTIPRNAYQARIAAESDQYVDKFRIFDGVAKWTAEFTPPTADENWLVAYLPFDDSTTLDKCGGTWTAYNNPTLSETGAISGKALQNPTSSSYLKRTEPFAFSGQPFTVSCYFRISGDTTTWARPFWQFLIDTNNRWQLDIEPSGVIGGGILEAGTWHNVRGTQSLLDGKIHHSLVVYENSTGYLYVDGELIGTFEYTTTTTKNYTLYLLYTIANASNHFYNGAIDEFKLYDGVALHDLRYERQKYPVVWLPFDSSVTADKCGNTWTADSGATLTTTNAFVGKALTGGGISMSGAISLGGQDFTVDYWATGLSGVSLWLNGQSYDDGAGRLIYLEPNWQGDNSKFATFYYGAATSKTYKTCNITKPTSPTHFAFVYQHSAGTIKVYVGGSLATSATVTIPRNDFTVQVNTDSGRYLDELRIWDGVAKWTANFTPPTAADYT